MRPLTLQEFAEDMRRKGDIRDVDLADEILALIDIEQEVAEPYLTLCSEVGIHAPNGMAPLAGVEWLGDRSNLLGDVERLLEKAGHAGDVDVVVEKLCKDLAEAREILTENGLREYDL